MHAAKLMPKNVHHQLVQCVLQQLKVALCYVALTRVLIRHTPAVLFIIKINCTHRKQFLVYITI